METFWVDGGVIFLNGVSSAGKTSIAAALQARITRPCVNWGIDVYERTFQPGLWDADDRIDPYWTSVIQGFHAAAAAMARTGNLVIVDDVLEPTTTPLWRDYFGEMFGDVRFLFVGVDCPLDVIEKRERVRQDRLPDLAKARWQYDKIHADIMYDLRIDTSGLSPEEGAEAILAFVRSGQRLRALQTLRRKAKISD